MPVDLCLGRVLGSLSMDALPEQPLDQSRSNRGDPLAAQASATVISSPLSAAADEQMSMAEVGRTLQGRSLGPYLLERFVGGGGMGVVFRALDTTLNRIVAVKVLLRQQSADEEMLRRFKNEAQSAARLDHENIGRVHAVGDEDGWHYIVFEFIEGTNLREVIQESGPFDLPRTIDTTIQIADALEHAAQRDVVHRDIKPSNIIITPAGRARIVDMGLARLHQPTGDQDLTVSGMTLGTFDYISPEQARDPRSADTRSDLYSLGCTVFFMLVGRPPFADGTMVQKLLQQQHDAPPAIDLLRPDVPQQFALILGRLMEKNPANRYQRPIELVADLHAFAAKADIQLAAFRPRDLVPVQALEQPPAAKLPWILPLFLLAAIVAILWYRSISMRVDAHQTASDLAAKLDTELALDAAASTAPVAAENMRRVVAVPVGPADYASLAEAVSAALDGDEIELVFSGVREELPFAIDGKHLVLRAAVGYQPIIRFINTPVASADSATCTITNGSLEIQGVGVQSGSLTTIQKRSTTAGGERLWQPVLFALHGTAGLVCEDLLLEMLDDSENLSDPEAAPALSSSASVIKTVCESTEASTRQEIRISRCTVRTDAVFLDASRGGRVDVMWSGGSFKTPARFLLAEGSSPSSTAGKSVRLSLKNASFVCDQGFAFLLDSPARPVAPLLQVLAESCQFVIPQTNALLEQSGIADADFYRTAIEWIDAGSRYAGSSVFKRIDGSAERIEIEYAASSQPLIHTPQLKEPPDELPLRP